MNLRWPVYYGYRNKKVVWFTLEIPKLNLHIHPDSSIYYDIEFTIDPSIKEVSELKYIEEEVLYEKLLVGIRKLINMQIDEYLELLCSNIGLN